MAHKDLVTFNADVRAVVERDKFAAMDLVEFLGGVDPEHLLQFGYPVFTGPDVFVVSVDGDGHLVFFVVVIVCLGLTMGFLSVLRFHCYLLSSFGLNRSIDAADRNELSFLRITTKCNASQHL